MPTPIVCQVSPGCSLLTRWASWPRLASCPPGAPITKPKWIGRVSSPFLTSASAFVIMFESKHSISGLIPVSRYFSASFVTSSGELA